MALIQAAVGGVRWASLSMLSVTIIQMIRLVVLARVLGPEAFGLLAMMLVVIGFAEVFSQSGLSEAIIQRHAPTSIELSSLYWLNIAIGGLFYIVLLQMTPLISYLYSAPELEELLSWLVLVFIISPWGVQFKTLLQKSLKFKPLAVVDILTALIGSLLTIILALQGYGVWSLVWGQLAQSVVKSVLLVVVAWRLKMLPGFCIHPMAIKPYLSFALYRMGSHIINYFNSRVDQLVVGAMLGPQALGYYSMAFNLVLHPVSRINPVLTQVAFPVLVRVVDDKEKLKRGYFRMLDLLTSINAPVLIGVAAVAPLLIPVLLGDHWSPIAPLIQILALFSLVRSTGNAGGSLILAAGRADWALYWNLMLLMIIPLVMIVGAKLANLSGVAWSLLGLQTILLFVWYYFIVRRLLGDCFSGFMGAITSPVIFALLMALVIIAVAPLLSTLLPALQLTIQVLLGVGAYVCIYLLFRKEFVKQQLKLFFKR